MGIVERELGTVELSDGTSYRIELNRNGRIHIHVDSARVDMTVDEFTQFAAVVADAKDALQRIKELDG